MFLHRHAPGRRSLLLVTGIIALASAGAMLPTAPIPRLSGLTPAAYVIAILGDAATAFVLLSTWKYESGRRSTFVIGLTFAACAIVLLLATLTLPLTPGNPPVMDASAQTGIWLYVFWHVFVAAGAISYLLLRRDGSVGRNPKKFLLIAIGVSSAAVAAAASAAFAWTSHLPTLVMNTSVSGLLSTGVGPAVLVLLVTAIVCVLRISDPMWIDRSITVSLLAITLEFALFLAGGFRYSASYYVGRILLVPGASFVLLSALRVEAQLARSAFLDGLTEIANRRQFDDVLEREWHRALRERSSIALLMIDVDVFKTYNDRYGHQMGDEVLKKIAGCIVSSLGRPTDVGARYGGEEFAVLMPGTTASGGRVIAEKIRTAVVGLDIAHAGNVYGVASVSVGVASMHPSLLNDKGALVRAADRALYDAKRNGRNRVEISMESGAPVVLAEAGRT